MHGNLPQELSPLCGRFTTKISAPTSNYSMEQWNIILGAYPLISFTAYHAVDVACFILERTRFSEDRHVVCANDASQPIGRHFNSCSHVVSDMKIGGLCPSFGSNDRRKRHEIPLISKLGIVHPLGI